MAKEPKSELIVPEIVTEVTIDKDDVLAVGITEAEEYMQEQLDGWKDEQKKKEAEAAEHSKNRTQILAADGAEFAHAIEHQLREGLACLNCKKLEFNHSTSEICMHPGTRKRPTYSVQINVNERGNGHGALSLQRTFTRPAPKEAAEEFKAQHKAQDEATAAGQQALEWKRRLTRIPQYERKLRAELAKNRLGKTADGKAVLAAMLGDVKKKVLALPGG
jgi:hypothetical protein